MTRGRILSVVHPVRALLAPCVAGADRLSIYMADQPAIPDHWHHTARSLCPVERDSLPAGTPAARPASDLKGTMNWRAFAPR